MKEPKDLRFRRLAEARVNKIISMIRLLGNCSHTGNYEYTPEQVEQIFSAIQFELNKAHKRYRASMENTGRFSLSDSPEFKEFPSVSLALPDGSILIAKAINDENFPAVNIDLLTAYADEEQHVCFVEYNPERDEGMELSVGVYTKGNEDTTYYRSYNDRKGIE